MDKLLYDIKEIKRCGMRISHVNKNEKQLLTK